MRLLLVRHAEAAPGKPDALRVLTEQGERQARRLGDELAAQGVQPAVILTSPLARARQTAEALGAVLGADVEIDERLAPGATPDGVREAVGQRGETVVAVGHQPDVAWIATVLGRLPAVADFPPAGLAVLELPWNAVEVNDLRKSYEGAEAVRGISFAIPTGEVFGLLGPNGAGKTTTVEILESYRKRDAGDVTVLGEDPARAPDAWRGRLGIVPQSGELFPNLTVLEHLRLFAAYYERPLAVDDVIRMVGLEEKRGARYRTLSGGQRRRLDLGVALVGDPELVFLDEPTTGFDPAARRSAWDTIRSLRDLGKTILLTTHYIEEAHRLADRVAVLSRGEIVAQGTPAELIAAGAATEIHYRRNGSEVVVRTEDPTRTLHELTGAALAAGETLEGLEVRQPTLEEIYLSLTGEGLE